MSSRCDRPTAMETEYAGTPRSALCVPSIGSRTRVASPAVDEAGLFAQHVEAGLLVLEDPKDRGLGHPVDPRAGCAVGPAAHDLGGVLDELRDRMLDGLGELEEKLLHGRPTAFLDIELTPFAPRTCNWRALLVSNRRLHSAGGGAKPSWWSWFSASHGVACSRSV